jgi:hypothetical protein
MGLDLRYPIGLMFGIYGLLLTGYGLAFPEARAPLTAVNVNLYAGVVMLLFGVVMLGLAQRAKR